MKELQPHHVAWLSGNPDRSEQWLREMFRHGFQVHHLDGDHSNDDPQNLLLINAQDHMSLHGVVKKVRAKHKRDPVERPPSPPPMTAEQFLDWMASLQITAQEAAELLDVHANTITKYRRGGAPRVVALACSALYHRLGEWNGSS